MQQLWDKLWNCTIKKNPQFYAGILAAVLFSGFVWVKAKYNLPISDEVLTTVAGSIVAWIFFKARLMITADNEPIIAEMKDKLKTLDVLKAANKK